MITPNDDIRFPDIYICNLNENIKSFRKKHDITNSEKYNASTGTGQQNYAKHTHSCEDMLLKVKWNDKPLEFFMKTNIESTEYGVCCIVSPYQNFVDPSLKNHSKQGFYGNVPKGYATNGIQAGFMAVLDLEAFDHATSSDSAGFKIGLADTQDFIVMRQKGFNAQAGMLSEIAIVPTTIETTQDAIDRFTPEERNCYTDNEFDLIYTPKQNGFRYSMQNCLYDRMVDMVVERCNCTMTNYVKLHNLGDVDLSTPMCYMDRTK